jgi:hypothetical protein
LNEQIKCADETKICRIILINIIFRVASVGSFPPFDCCRHPMPMRAIQLREWSWTMMVRQSGPTCTPRNNAATIKEKIRGGQTETTKVSSTAGFSFLPCVANVRWGGGQLCLDHQAKFHRERQSLPAKGWPLESTIETEDFEVTWLFVCPACVDRLPETLTMGSDERYHLA